MVNMNVIIVALIVCSLMTPVSVLGAWLVLKIEKFMKEENKDEENIL